MKLQSQVAWALENFIYVDAVNFHWLNVIFVLIHIRNLSVHLEIDTTLLSIMGVVNG